MPLRRRGKIFQAQSQDCRDCYWTNPWRDPLHFIDVNGRRRRKRAVDFSIVFQTLRQKDRGKRQSVLSKIFLSGFFLSPCRVYLYFKRRGIINVITDNLICYQQLCMGTAPTYSIVRNRTLSHPSFRLFANSLFASCLGIFICSWCK